MKLPIATFVVPLVMTAVPALAESHASESCDARFEAVSADWAEAKKSLTEPEDVSVSTEEGEVEVAAQDAKPTENWFGNPPDAETIDGYLAEAERAMQDGDTEACLEQLKNVEDAMDPDQDEMAKKMSDDDKQD